VIAGLLDTSPFTLKFAHSYSTAFPTASIKDGVKNGMTTGIYFNYIAYVMEDYITGAGQLAHYLINTVANSAMLKGTSLSTKKIYSIEAVDSSVFYITLEKNNLNLIGFSVYETDTASGNIIFKQFQENDFRETGFKFSSDFHRNFIKYFPHLATIVGLNNLGDVSI